MATHEQTSPSAALPAVPGNDASTSGFEGFANKEASKGDPIFPAKNEPQAAGDAPPADNTTFRVNVRKGGSTSAGFIKSIGD